MSLGIWDVPSGQQIERFPLPINVSDFAGFYPNPDWTQAAVALRDGSAAVWDISEGEQLFDLPGHEGSIELEYSQNGSLLVTYSSPDGMVIASDAQTGEIVRQLDTGKRITDHAASADGRWLALATTGDGGDRVVQIWDLDLHVGNDELLPVATFTGHNNSIFVLAFSPYGTHLATSGGDTTAKIWALDYDNSSERRAAGDAQQSRQYSGWGAL